MKRLVIVLCLMVVGFAMSAQSAFKEGTHYEVLDKNKSEKPIVKEFFSLFCQHCFQFEPFMDSLASSLPNGVEFVKSHVDYLPRDNKPVSSGIVKAFIMMGDLGKEKELAAKFFAAIHLGQAPVASENDIKMLFIDSGVSGSKFDQLYNSKSVKDRAKAMSELWIEYEISSVPTVVVNEKYKINMSSLKSISELIDITLFLLKQK